MLIGAKYSSIKSMYTMFRDADRLHDSSFASLTSRVDPFSADPCLKLRTRAAKNVSSLPVLTASSAAQNTYKSGNGWYYIVGSTHFPPRHVQSNREAWQEFLKSIHSVASGNLRSCITASNWGVSARQLSNITNTTATDILKTLPCVEGGSYVAAQNFESQSHKAYLLESGINTLASTMYLFADFPAPNRIPTLAIANLGNGLFAGQQTNHSNLTQANGFPQNIGNVRAGGDTLESSNAHLRMDHFVHYDGVLIIDGGICNTRF
jgi:hypothetical protein